MKDPSSTAAPRVVLATRRQKVIYFFVSLVLVLSLRMLENTVHELTHGIVVLLVGGHLDDDPFLITPFGGFTRWLDVPGAWLSLVNISGSLVAGAVMLGLFLPLFHLKYNPSNRESSKKRFWDARASFIAKKMAGYWGGVVVPVNVVFYWFMSPLIGTASHFDPIAFATNLGIEPTWVVGILAIAPMIAVIWNATRGTRRLVDENLEDPSHFHLKCLAIYFVLSLGFPVVSYLNLLDRFAWW